MLARPLPASCLTSVLFLCAPPSFGQAECAKLQPPGGDNFGHSVSVSGSTALVGASNTDFATPDATAFLYERTAFGWTEAAQLTPSDGGLQDDFGYAVSLSGDVAFVGAPFDNGAFLDSGSVYVFERSALGWTEVAKLRASDESSELRFGAAVCVLGDVAAVGAPGPSSAGIGAAYVFERGPTGWSETQRLTASDGTGDRFGVSVALSPSRLVVGAQEHSHDGRFFTGGAYVFEETLFGWLETAELLGHDTAAGDGLGTAVSVLGDTVLVGAPFDEDGTGAAYVFEQAAAGWSETAKLLANDAALFDQFGEGLTLVPDGAIVGSWRDDDLGDSSGAVYFFEQDGGGWTQSAKRLASDGGAGDGFGLTVSESGGTLLVGAPFADGPGGFAMGSAYVISVDAAAASFCSSAPNSSGRPATIGVQGGLFIPANTTTLVAQHCPPLVTGVFFYGTDPTQVPFGDGFQCISRQASAIHRVQPPQQTNAAGEALRLLDFTSLPAGGEITPGSTWRFQFWFLDPNGPGGAGFNLTDALEVTFCN